MVRGEQGQTPLTAATENREEGEQIVKQLLDAKADVNFNGSNKVISMSTSRAFSEKLELANLCSMI